LSRFICFVGLWGLCLDLQAAEKLLLMQEARLGQLKSSYAGNEDPNLPPEGKAIATKIVKEADKRMGKPVITITENENLQASKDPHDYFSIGRYFWPDPSKPDGLPWINRDGETNPDAVEASDEKKLGEMIHAVEYLALAYHLTGDEKYGAEAARFLRGFFLDAETKMNPHLDYGQSVPGKATGRGWGLIDTRGFMILPDVLKLLEKCPAWKTKDREEMKAWWTAYGDWMQTSKIGLQEKSAPNNHGAAYDVQLSAVLVMAEKEDEARKVLGESLPGRLDAHITSEGKQPRELARTKSLSYSCFNLKNICKGAVMAQSLGIDLWNHEGEGGKGSLRKAMLYLVPFLKNPDEWSEKQITKFDSKEARVWLNDGAVVYDDAGIRSAKKEFAPMEKADVADWISTPTQK
jgi:Alginate lyase